MLKRELFGGVCAFILTLLCAFPLVFASVRINEIELNPAGDDFGNEWIELYSDQQLEINNWTIESNNGRNMSFNASFSGYLVVIASRNLLTNSNNSLKLIDDKGNPLEETSGFTDNANNDKTWQYCANAWIFSNSTSGEENACLAPKNQTVIENITQSNNSNQNLTNENKTTTIDNNYDLEYNTPAKSNSSVNNEQVQTESSGIIKLGSAKEIKEENRIVYKSKKEYIKDYAIYGFTLLCIILMALVLIQSHRQNRENLTD